MDDQFEKMLEILKNSKNNSPEQVQSFRTLANMDASFERWHKIIQCLLPGTPIYKLALNGMIGFAKKFTDYYITLCYSPQDGPIGRCIYGMVETALEPIDWRRFWCWAAEHNECKNIAKKLQTLT